MKAITPNRFAVVQVRHERLQPTATRAVSLTWSTYHPDDVVLDQDEQASRPDATSSTSEWTLRVGPDFVNLEWDGEQRGEELTERAHFLATQLGRVLDDGMILRVGLRHVLGFASPDRQSPRLWTDLIEPHALGLVLVEPLAVDGVLQQSLSTGRIDDGWLAVRSGLTPTDTGSTYLLDLDAYSNDRRPIGDDIDALLSGWDRRLRSIAAQTFTPSGARALHLSGDVLPQLHTRDVHEEVHEDVPADVATDELASLRNAAEAFAELSDYESAYELFSLAVEKAPWSSDVRMERAAALWYAGAYSDAVAELDEVLQAEPGDVAARAMRGQVLVDAGEYAAALDDLDIAMRGTDSSSTAAAYLRSSRALALAAVGQDALAFKEFDLAVAATPGNAWAFWNRAIAHGWAGDHLAALQDLRTALRAGDPPLIPRQRSSAQQRAVQLLCELIEYTPPWARSR